MGIEDILNVKVKQTSGAIIRAMRRSLNLTLKEVSELSGIGQSNLSLIENDKVELGLKRAELLGAVFGIDPIAILYPKGFYNDPTVKKIRKRSIALLKKKGAA